MSLNLDCFDYIVGLTKTACTDCYTVPADAGISISNLFIDELDSLRQLAGLENCEIGADVFSIMENSRDEATLYFMSDVSLKLQEFYELKRYPFKGTIGRLKITGNRSLIAGRYAGIRIKCADIVGGTLKITNIGTYFNGSGNVTLFIYNNISELVGTYVLSAVANTHTQNTVDIELPLHEDYIDELEYFLVYQVGALQPKDNLVDSSSCKLCFDTCNPYWYSQTNKQYGWAQWLMVGNFYETDLSNLDDCTSSTSSYMNGLTLQVELDCNINEILCYEEINFKSNPLAMSMAHAIRYKAAELLANKVFLSPNLNRDNLINGEALLAARDVWITKYDQIIEKMIPAIDITINDCLTCRDQQDIILGGIFS